MILYRYVGKPVYSYGDGTSWLAGAEIICEEYEVVRETAKGRWVQRKGQRHPAPKKHFVLDGARKKFAYAEKESALESFGHRSKWRISHLARQLESAKEIRRQLELLLAAAKEKNDE